MKKHKGLPILFITTLLLSLALPLLSQTMTEKKVRDIQALHNALLPGQRIILDQEYRCGYQATWTQNTQVVFKNDDEGNVYIHIPIGEDRRGIGCNEFDLERVNGIEVQDSSTGTVIRSIYW